ncbi:MAG: hypothetical protein PHW83_11930, partial [Bacteroidales bacterium]|nr:hypothetical protein [Bacteroidales bacterium]
MKKKLSILIALVVFGFGIVRSQITAPTASTSFSTSYTSGFLSSGGTNDLVYVFCGNQSQTNIGQLTVSSVGCTVVWYYYDGFSYSALGQTGSTATGLTSGLYMAQVNCGGVISCHRAWVWVNQTFVDVNPIDPGCETFTLTGQADVLDNQFVINDPPGTNFEIDEDTYIQVCFWANHTYVSDLGFYLKAPGYQATEPNNDGVVALLPAASDWGPDGEYQSNLTIPWSVTGCDPADMNVPCNPGNGVDEFCFSTNYWLGGPALTPGNPAQVPCVCDLPIPLNGMYAPAESWSRIYGFMAGDPGWAVQIYDCEPIDYGSLTMARLTFSAVTDCGQTTFTYDSGEINSTINDNSCSASTASIYVVPPSEPAGEYTVNSSITDYSWSCTGSGFIGSELSHQIVAGTGDFPVTTSDFILTVTETINVPGSPECEAIASETFITLPTDATLTPVAPVCANVPPFQIQAADGGGVWTTNAPENTIVNGMFYPSVPPAGTWTVNYSLGGPCPDEDEITITVYETIEIQNFSDNICDASLENFTVSFDVVNNHGDPTDFLYDTGSGTQSGTASFSQSYPSPSDYDITVTDENGCSEYILSGYKDCGCISYAGTLSTTSLIQLCEGECTDDLFHNGNHILDANDMLEFIIHNGGDPLIIYDYNPTEPVFCLNDISGGQTGQVYYISAIAGNEVGGHVDFGDHCFSQSMNTGVIWYQNPVSYIAETEVSTCGLTIDLSANEVLPGEVGTWVATSDFWPTGTNTVHDNDISVIVSDFGDVMFSWIVINNICSASDDIMVHFNDQPNAYAGEDFQICGNEATLEATLSLPSSSGYWSGNGSFDNSSSETTGVTSSGTQVFTWREENGACWDEDFVTVVFIQEPQPTVTMGVDTVCGVVYDLSVFNVTGTGSWAAYEEGVLSTPAPLYVDGINNPNTQVIVSYGSELADSIDFVWTESINVGGIVCTNTATKRVVFARQP